MSALGPERTASAYDVRTASAYDVCEQITRVEARNFSYGIRLLPRAKRRALSAVYALARRIDDLGDGDLDDAEKERQLEELRGRIRTLDVGDDPVLEALADARTLFPLPLGCFDELIDGCRADATVSRYPDIDSLVGYCRCVAGSVGRLSSSIFMPADPDRAQGLADSLGVALQLTNILRDVEEDREMGRVYLPADELEQFGFSSDLTDRSDPDKREQWRALMEFQAERARSWYDEGSRLLPLLDRRSAACTAAMAGIYRRLLDRISADPGAVLTGRVALSTPAKTRVAIIALTKGTL